MNVSSPPPFRFGILLAAASVAACTAAGRPVETVVPSAQQAGTTTRGNANVLTAAEIAAHPGLTNALEAVQTLRPAYLRGRTAAARPPGMIGAGAEGQAVGRRPGAVRGAGSPSSEDEARAREGRTASDPGIVVYLDRQRYGETKTLREFPVASLVEIRFLSPAEANTLFGMGHPHGVIQVISKQGAGTQ